MAEFIDLLLLIVWGLCLGVFFHFYHLIFARLETRKILYGILYLIWWCGVLLLTVLFLLMVNGGELRLYCILGMLLGVVLFFQWVLPSFGPFFARFFYGIQRIFSFFFRLLRRFLFIVLFPFGFLLRILEKVIIFLFWPLRKLAEKLKRFALPDDNE